MPHPYGMGICFVKYIIALFGLSHILAVMNMISNEARELLTQKIQDSFPSAAALDNTLDATPRSSRNRRQIIMENNFIKIASLIRIFRR